MKQILLDNAYESWRNTLYYHNKIMSGLPSLSNQKGFVSSLQNAVELFFKQIMLDDPLHLHGEIQYTNDKGDSQTARLVERFNDNAKKIRPNIEEEYRNSTNLNNFFLGLPSDIRNEFCSISFNKLIIIHMDLLGLSTPRFKDDLELLKKLRNKETHFFIDPHDYLSEADFCQLHNFMVNLYPFLKQRGLMPTITERTSQGDIIFNSEHTISLLRPPTKTIDSFDYIEKLKSNSVVKELMKGLYNDMCIAGEAGENDISTITWYIMIIHSFEFSRYDEIYSYISLMKTYGLIDIQSDGELEETYNANNCETELTRTYRLIVRE